MKKIKLSRNEHILAVVPSTPAGPGWSNAIVSIYIGDYVTNKFRTAYLQPDEQPAPIQILFSVGKVTQDALLYEINKLTKKEK